MKLQPDYAPCSVCGSRLARYVHEGARYCVGNQCQLVAAGMIAQPEALRRLKAKRERGA